VYINYLPTYQERNTHLLGTWEGTHFTTQHCLLTSSPWDEPQPQLALTLSNWSPPRGEVTCRLPLIHSFHSLIRVATVVPTRCRLTLPQPHSFPFPLSFPKPQPSPLSQPRVAFAPPPRLVTRNAQPQSVPPRPASITVPAAAARHQPVPKPASQAVQPPRRVQPPSQSQQPPPAVSQFRSQPVKLSRRPATSSPATVPAAVLVLKPVKPRQPASRSQSAAQQPRSQSTAALVVSVSAAPSAVRTVSSPAARF
jgi:hypothetical protein